MERIKNYLLAQLDKPTAWIGLIGLVLLALHLGSFLFILFIALVVLPLSSFTNVFAKWTKEIRDITKED